MKEIIDGKILIQTVEVQPAVKPAMSVAKCGVRAPTCKVCGDESSGYHYGVDSCEGCKGFFRRCITQGMTHKCSNEEKCEITPFTRNSCQYCRLKKCFSVGMSREASRLGRRPKRLKDSGGGESSSRATTNQPIAPYPPPTDLYKLRMAELQNLLQQNGTFKTELMQAFLSAAQASFKEHQRNPGLDNDDKSKKQISPGESGYSSFSSPGSSKSDSPIGDIKSSSSGSQFNNNNPDTTIVDSSVADGSPSDSNVDEKSDLDLSNINLVDENMLIELDSADNMNLLNIKSEVASPSQSCSQANMVSSSNDAASFMPVNMLMSPNIEPQFPSIDQIQSLPMVTDAEDDGISEMDIDRIMADVLQTPTDVRKTLINQVIETVYEAHMETCNPNHLAVNEANARIAGEVMPDLSELSLNSDMMWKQFLKNMVPEITLAVQFCKRIPGFGEISQDDQILLIKQGSFEILACRMCNLVDVDNQEMFDPDMKMKCPRKVIQSMPMGGVLDEFFTVAGQFNPLNLTDAEIGLFSAVLVICPARCNLKSAKAIDKLQILLLQCLFQQIKEVHENVEDVFIKTLHLVPVFRRLNEKHSMVLNSMRLKDEPGMNAFPPLHQEVFDCNFSTE